MDLPPILDMLTHCLVIAQTTINGATTEEPSMWLTYATNAGIILGIFVLPFVASHFITAAVRMPSHSTRLGLMLAAIAGAFIFSYMRGFELKRGIDMKGGTILIYDIMEDNSGQKIDAGALSAALMGRVNPSGTKEMVIRPMNQSQIEIIVPETDEMAVRRLQEILQNTGQLEFRIVANSRDHGEIINLAKEQYDPEAPKTDVVDADGKVVGRWYRVARDTKKKNGVFPLKTNILGDTVRDAFTGQIVDTSQVSDSRDQGVEKWLAENGIQEVDLLMAFAYAGRPFAVVHGDDLDSANLTYNNQTGSPEVSFKLNPTGGIAMTQLTGGINTSDETFKRRMAIIMDEEVLSAPNLNSPISSQGVIQGNFTTEEVQSLVTVLRSGRLPATLSAEPASKEVVGAGLGASTISKGTTASIWAVAATFLTIIFYYRFAGIVAAIALLINGLLIFGTMIFIQQPLTLPGLAGLVLTVGMSVDANVLIFERIREERAKGSAPRMSIRNGFDRAFTTIIDSNLTTLIAAIVLYWIGTDQVRGFAVALIIGIATSMFTATFCSRIIFEICEKLKLVNLSMADGVGAIKKSFFGNRDINFMGWKQFSFVFSMILIVAGIVAVSLRGKDLLNIDFTGGASVTFQLTEAIDADDLRELTGKILVADEGEEPIQATLQSIEKEPANTVFRLITSISDPDVLAEKLLAGFNANDMQVVSYKVTYLPKTSNSQVVTSMTRFVSFQTPEAEPQTGEAESETSPDTNEPAATEAGQEAAVEAAAIDIAVEVADEASISAPIEVETTEFQLQFASSNEDQIPTAADGTREDSSAKFNGAALQEELLAAAKRLGTVLNENLIVLSPEPRPSDWTSKDISSHTTWNVTLPTDSASASAIVAELQSTLQQQPRWLSLSSIGSRVAGEMQQRAIGAILVSLVFIVAYIWFRFQKVAYGLAAVVALVHDVLITLGVLAMCHWLSGPIGSFLLIDDFKIGLTEVAAFLTIIGYSLNDTIVVFDRIREVRGRSPLLTADMVNASVNQTLSRTLLTSGTTLLTVLLLYIFGGEGIHTFAFALMIGILVGTYSSIFVASPVLLWITNFEKTRQQQRSPSAA